MRAVAGGFAGSNPCQSRIPAEDHAFQQEQKGRRDSLREAVFRIASVVNILEQDNGSFVEESIRAVAGMKFGTATLSQFLLRSAYDVAVFTLPHETKQEKIRALAHRLEKLAERHFVDYIQGLQKHFLAMAEAGTHTATFAAILQQPWVNNNVIDWTALGKAKEILKTSRFGQLVGKVLFANPKKKVSELSAFSRSDGPGLCILLWKASTESETQPEFIDELECDCRGKIDLLDATKKTDKRIAVVMGAEIKRSSGAFTDAKRQLLRRFKLISMVLEFENVDVGNSIFIGRVFYREASSNKYIASSEDGAGFGFNALSWYFHRT